jgi:integrase
MRVALTDRFCAGAQPQKGGPQTDYFDAIVSGLALRVAGASKSWSLMTTEGGKRVRRTLGHYPALSLADARTAALEAKGGMGRSGATTVAHAVVMFLKDKPRRTLAEVQRRFNKNVIPEIGALRLVDLHRADAARVVDGIKERGAPIEALRVGEDLRALGRWAVTKGLLDRNPLEGMALPPKSKPRERVLSEEEITTLWHGVGVLRADYAAVIRLALVTGQRRGEVVGMLRAELDLTAGTWTLPGERTKNGKRHVVPLSGLAVELITSALAVAGDSPRVFPAIAREEYLTNEIHRRQLSLDHWTLHDMRRTALTRMQELGVSPAVLGAIANHFGGSVTAKHYAKYDYAKEKRAALDLWCDRLRALIVGAHVAVVVPLRA